MSKSEALYYRHFALEELHRIITTEPDNVAALKAWWQLTSNVTKKQVKLANFYATP